MTARRAAAAVLLSLLLAAAGGAQGQQEPACRTYTSKGLIHPAVGFLQDVIVVQDAFVVAESTVSLDVSHRRIGALKITLGAQPFSSAGSSPNATPQITLKSHGLGRRGDNLFHTTFSDSAPISFPVNATDAPFSGTYRPVQRLAFLTDGDQTVAGAGGSQGLWTLAVADVAPNNTLREIALNGWTLVLCPRGASPAPTPPPYEPTPPSSEPATPTSEPTPPSSEPTPPSSEPTPTPSEPTPQPSEPATPAPPAADPEVVALNGPPEITTFPAPITPPSTLPGGWQIVYKPTGPGLIAPPPPPPATPGAPAPALGTQGSVGGGAVAQPLQQLMAQKPMLALLQQQIAAITSGMGGECDAACTQAKANLWSAAALGMFLRYAHNKHHGSEGRGALLEKMRDLLPGDNKGLAELHGWMDKHSSDLQGLSSFLKDRMKLPKLSVNGSPFSLGSGREGMQQLTALLKEGGSSLSKLKTSFAAAGDKLAKLAEGLTSGKGGKDLQGLMSAMTAMGSGTGLPNLNLGGGGKLGALFGASSGNLRSFFEGPQGGSVEGVNTAGLAELSDAFGSLMNFDFSSFA